MPGFRRSSTSDSWKMPRRFGRSYRKLARARSTQGCFLFRSRVSFSSCLSRRARRGRSLQGFDDRCVSHNGGHAAFSMDMSKVGVSDSTGQPLFLSTHGRLVEFEDDHTCGASNTDSNFIVLRAKNDFFLVYHHLNRNSVHKVLH